MTKSLLEQQNEERQDEKTDLDKEEAGKLNQIYLVKGCLFRFCRF